MKKLRKWFKKTPSWFIELFKTVIILILGFLIKTIEVKINDVKDQKKELIKIHSDQISKLDGFKKQLDLSKYIYNQQCDLRDRLIESLTEIYSLDTIDKYGYIKGL